MRNTKSNPTSPFHRPRRGLGAGAAQQGVDLQTGYCHVDVPRLALVWQADADQADPSPPRVVSSAAKEVVPLAVKPVDEDGQR